MPNININIAIFKMNLKEDEYVKQLKSYKTEEFSTDSAEINLDDIQNCIINDEFGNLIRFGDIFAKKTSIIVFLRHFLCFTSQDYVEDLLKVPQSVLEAGGVQIVLVGLGEQQSIKKFRKEMRCEFPIFVDRDLQLYKKLKFKTLIDIGTSPVNNVHIKTGLVYGILRSTWRAMVHQNMAGDIKQNGGSMVVGPGNKLCYFHVDETLFDKALINDLLLASGLSTINFRKDSRVHDV